MWNSNDTQYCDGCGVYHYRDDCTDPTNPMTDA